MHVVGERAVGGAQRTEIVSEPRQRIVPGRTRGWPQREERGERPRSLLESLDAEELAPERCASFGTAASKQGSPHG